MRADAGELGERRTKVFKEIASCPVGSGAGLMIRF